MHYKFDKDLTKKLEDRLKMLVEDHQIMQKATEDHVSNRLVEINERISSREEEISKRIKKVIEEELVTSTEETKVIIEQFTQDLESNIEMQLSKLSI